MRHNIENGGGVQQIGTLKMGEGCNVSLGNLILMHLVVSGTVRFHANSVFRITTSITELWFLPPVLNQHVLLSSHSCLFDFGLKIEQATDQQCLWVWVGAGRMIEKCCLLD